MLGGKTSEQWIAQYASSHRHPVNRTCHTFGIPTIVISLALFRGLSKLGVRDSTILENNITQTAGSAGESIAFGVGVTMPAIMRRSSGSTIAPSRPRLIAIAMNGS